MPTLTRGKVEAAIGSLDNHLMAARPRLTCGRTPIAGDGTASDRRRAVSVRPTASASPESKPASRRGAARHQGRGIGRILLVVGLLVATASIASAAQLAGVSLPDEIQVAGTRLVLNGIGLRTYSALGIRIYVAGLYLERRSNSAEAILRSPETKLLVIRFLRDVGQDAARNAWRGGFANNCPAPCRLNPQDIAHFIAEEPAVRAGDVSQFLFTRNGMTVTLNGRKLGSTDDPYFAQQVLRTFLGPVPPTPRVKRELLGGG